MNEKQTKAAEAMRDTGMTQKAIATALGVELAEVREALRPTPKPTAPKRAAPSQGEQLAFMNSELQRRLAVVVASRSVDRMGTAAAPPLTGSERAAQLKAEYLAKQRSDYTPPPPPRKVGL